MTAMGVKDPGYLPRLRKLLRLPDEVWTLADDHNWTEAQLRPLTQMSNEEAINVARYWAGLPATNFVETDSFAVVKQELGKIGDEVEKMSQAEQLRVSQMLKQMIQKIERDAL